MFPRTCKAFYEKNIKKFVKKLDFTQFNNDYILVNDYKMNEMMIVFNSKFFHAILYSFPSGFDRLDKMTTFLHH